MMSGKNCLFIATTVLCLLLLAAGCGRSAKQTATTQEKLAETVDTGKETKVDTGKAVETEIEPKKVVETKVEPEKAVETKVEPEIVVETKVEPEKTVETKVEPEKVVETTVEPDEQKGAVQLVLKFEPNDVSTYKVVMYAQKSVLWEGPAPTKPSAFKGGLTSNRSEMTFTQQIKSVDEAGNAIALITIKELKYLAKVRDSVSMDFDSSREKDKSDPMIGLIGRSYSIKITPAGSVVPEVKLTVLPPALVVAVAVLIVDLGVPDIELAQHVERVVENLVFLVHRTPLRSHMMKNARISNSL